MKRRWIMVVLGAALLLSACVERKLFLHSDPPGAAVCLNGETLGDTPISIPYDYYGDFSLEVRLKGHRVDKRILAVHEPWFQVFPLDMFFDLFWPFTLEDRRVYAFSLESFEPVDLKDLPAILDRADALRFSNR